MMYTAVLSVGLVMTVWQMYSAWNRFGAAALIREPILTFSLYFGLIHFLTPLVKYRAGRFRYTDFYSDRALLVTAGLSISYYLVAIFANKVFSRHRNPGEFRSAQPPLLPRLARPGPWIAPIAIGLTAVTVWFTIRDLRIIGLSGGNFLNDRLSFAEVRGSARILTASGSTTSMLLLALWYSASRGKKLYGLLWVATVGITAFHSAQVSSRNTILTMAVLNLVVIVFAKLGGETTQRAQRRMTVVGLTMALALFVGITSVTLTRYAGDSTYLAERRDNVYVFMLDGAFGNDEALIWMEERGYEHEYGVTYIAAVTNWIPRSVWAGKPLGAGPRLINSISPGSYVLGASGNNSLTSGLIVEGRMNFGEMGAFAAIFAWAWSSSHLVGATLKARSLEKQLMFMGAAAFVSTSLLHSEFLGFTFRLALLVVPLWGISKLRSGRRSDFRGTKPADRAGHFPARISDTA